MLHMLVRLATILSLASSVLIATILMQPYDDGDLRTFFDAAANCPMPCWQGIRPGITTAAEAITRLDAHPWIGELLVSRSYRETGTGFVAWEWSGTQPSTITPNRRGDILVNRGMVWAVRIQTSMRFGDLWLSLDRPAQGSMSISGLTISADNRYTFRTAHEAVYPFSGGSIHALSTMKCPLRQERFWDAPVELQFYRPLNVYFPDYTLAEWFNRQSVCNERGSES